ALLVHPDGIDFRVLKPLALAIALFVTISAGFGAAVAHLVGAAAGDHAWPQQRSWWLLGPPLAFLLIPPFAVVAIVGVLVNRQAASGWGRTRNGRAVHLGAVVVMVGLFVLG